MNLASHIMSHYEMFKDLGGGNFEKSAGNQKFHENIEACLI